MLDRYKLSVCREQDGLPAGEGPSEAAPDSIRLDHYLKLTGHVRSGGEAKQRIQRGEVLVNGVVETHRSRKVTQGDRVTLDGETREVDVPEA